MRPALAFSTNACNRHPFESDIAKIYARCAIALFLTFSKNASLKLASLYLDVYAEGLFPITRGKCLLTCHNITNINIKEKAIKNIVSLLK